MTIPQSGIGTEVGGFRLIFGDGFSDLTVTMSGGVTNICDGAFECCYGLSWVVIPNSVKNIGDFAFRDCRELHVL